MTNPTGIEIQLEILKILKDGKIHTKNEVVEKTAKHFGKKISSTNSRNDVFAKDVVRQISVVRKNEWLKNPPNGVLIYPWENLPSFTCDIPSSVCDDILVIAKRPNPWIGDFLIVKLDGRGSKVFNFSKFGT